MTFLWFLLNRLDGDVDGCWFLGCGLLKATANLLLICPPVEHEGENEQDNPSDEKEFNHRSELC